MPPPLSLALGQAIGAVISEADIPLLPQPETEKDIKTETKKRHHSGRVSLAKKRKIAN